MNLPAPNPPPVPPEGAQAASPASQGQCANCGTPLLGEHCYACGQPVKGLVRHFSSLVGDVLDSAFNWDSRLPRTLWPLLMRPGYLTREYLAGRRVRYVSPFRLFFFAAVITFFLGSFVVSFDSNATLDFGGDSAIETARSIEEVEQARERALAELAATRAELDADAQAAERSPGQGGVGAAAGLRAGSAAITAREAAIRRQADERIAAFRKSEETGGPPPVPRFNRLQFGGDKPWDPHANPVRFQSLPGFANDWINRQIARTEKNLQRLREDPDQFKDAVLGAVPSTLFVLLPLFALMLKLAYVFKRRLYMEHLIVALHSHAYLCMAVMLLFICMALERWVPPDSLRLGLLKLAEVAIWFWMPVYLLIMQKRIYGQGWPMTLLKFTVIGLCYTVLLTFGAVFTTLVSLVWM